MSGGLALIPSYTTDNDFPAYQDRLLIKSLGTREGVVGSADCRVFVGSGLQVEVEKGKSFIEQSNAKQESSNTFYNGLYNVLNPTKQNPYNSVEVSSSNPQIAQIILRVYDVEELGITGSSFGRIEWLNGTPNAGATLAHIEEGKALEFGAAILPTSSQNLAYVIVPKNASVSSEFTVVDSRKWAIYKSPLITTGYVANVTAKSGEMIDALSSLTVTAPPSPQQNDIYGVFSKETTLIKSPGKKISGDFINEVEEITLLKNQHVIQLFNGTEWMIIAGEPKRTQVYSALTERKEGTLYTPSATRPVQVVGYIVGVPGEGRLQFKVGGVKMAIAENPISTGTVSLPTFKVLPGVSWEWTYETKGSSGVGVFTSYLEE